MIRLSQKNILGIVKTILGHPTAPFRETAVREYILAFCRQRRIFTAVDAMGNIVATYGRRYKNRPLVFVAHTDHPGFIIEKNSVNGRTTAIFHGGVEREYFKKGTPVRIFTRDGSVRASVVKALFNKKKKEKRVWLTVKGPVCRGDLAMWDLPACSIRGDKLYSRACDDVVGCAAILAMLDELVRRKVRRRVMALFTVAEEPGLHGAKYAAAKQLLSKDSVVISIETSSALPTAPIGKGVVIRVGDRGRIFNPAVTQWMLSAAQELQKQDKTFFYQRKLMDAGTCEASVFSVFGYTTGALCIPLGSYHNRDFSKKKIAAEYVSIRDMENMIKLFLVLAREGASGVQLKPHRPTYQKRSGTQGETFWE